VSFRPQADRAAKRYFSRHVDRMRFIRQMAAEANFGDPTSSAGAQGPAQIMPGTARAWGVKNVHDPNQAYSAAAKHMVGYLKAYHGSWAKALQSYNLGHPSSNPPAETRAYVAKILGGKGDAKAGGVGDSGPQSMPGDTIKPFGTKLTNETQFDAAGYKAAQRASIVGSLIARNEGTNSPLFKTGLLTTSSPSPQDFMRTVLSSKMTRGKAVNLAPGMDGGGGAAPHGMLHTALAFDRHHTPYQWGGGHGKIAKPNERVDCSGYVSAIHPELIQRIDDARRAGLTYDQVHEHLRNAGVPNPDRVLKAYAQTTLPDGRKREQVNLGDPHEQ
jgi:hypothetical protein